MLSGEPARRSSGLMLTYAKDTVEQAKEPAGLGPGGGGCGEQWAGDGEHPR